MSKTIGYAAVIIIFGAGHLGFLSWGVDPFDQSKVDSHKIEIKKILTD